MRKVYLKGAALALAAILACPGVCGVRALGDDMTDVDFVEDLEGFEEDDDFVEGVITEDDVLEFGSVDDSEESTDEWSEDGDDWIEDDSDWDEEDGEDEEDWGDGEDEDSDEWDDGDDEDWGDDEDGDDEEDWDDGEDEDGDDWGDGEDEDGDDWDEEDGDAYTVVFMDGDDIVSEQEVESGEYAEAPELTKTGYTLSWDTDFDEVTEDLTVSAVWTAKEYTVKFNANGGSVSTASMKVTYGKKIGKLPKATKTGYKFTGWYTKKKNGKKVKASTVVKTASNQTLYAGWKKEAATTKVKLAKPVVKKISGMKKKISVTVKTDSKATGYELQYSVKKNFKGSKVTSIPVKTGRKVVSGLKAKTKYYVRVRAYAKGTDGNTVYSKYSKVVSVSTLK